MWSSHSDYMKKEWENICICALHLCKKTIINNNWIYKRSNSSYYLNLLYELRLKVGILDRWIKRIDLFDLYRDDHWNIRIERLTFLICYIAIKTSIFLICSTAIKRLINTSIFYHSASTSIYLIFDCDKFHSTKINGTIDQKGIFISSLIVTFFKIETIRSSKR